MRREDVLQNMKKHNFNLLLIALILTISIVTAVSAADGATEGFPVDVALVGTLFLLGLYGAFKFAEQTWGADPTKWDYVKYLQIFAAAILVSVVMYFSTGVLGAATIEQITSALALLGGSVLTILGWKTAKNVATTGTIVNPEVVKPAAATAVEQAETVTVSTPPPAEAPVAQPYKKMSDTTRQWLTFDATPENKEKILKQIEAAEAAQLYAYQITFDGGYYNIVGGILNGSAGNPSGK